MARNVMWLVLGCLVVVLLGCEDPKQPVGVQNAQPAAAAAPAGGGGGGAAPAMPGMNMAAPPTTATTAPPVVAPKDPLIYLPSNVTFAVGGLPSAVAKSPNKVAAAFLSQFSPLTAALERVGLPQAGVESFWAAGNADLSEQALCVITAVDINQEAVRQILGANNIPKESRVWPLPGEAAATHALAVADARTLIIGRKSTVESALRKSPALLIKQGLGTINQVDADFWMAGDRAAAQIYFNGGLPLLGRYGEPFADLKAFGIGMILEGKTLTTNTAGTAPGGMPGMMPGGMPGGNMSAPPSGPGSMPMPTGPMNPMATANAAPGATPAVVAASTEQIGVSVMGGFLFASDAAAVKGKAPLDQFLTTAARQRMPKPQRFIPDLSGTGSGTPANGTGAGMAAMPGGGPNMDAMKKMGNMPVPANGAPSESQSNEGSSVAVIPEPPNAAAVVSDPKLQPTTPPAPQTIVVVAAGPAAVATPPGQPGASPMGSAPPGAASPMAPTGAGSPMPPGGAPPGAANPMATAPVNYGAAGPNPGSAGMPGSQGGGGGQWIHQQAAFVQFAYRFDAHDENIAFSGHLLHAMGVSPFGDSFSVSPLAALHKALNEARGPANAAGAQQAGFGRRGNSWMVHLLPFLGHQAIHKQWDVKWPLTYPANYKVSHAVIPEFLNPADPRQQWAGSPYADMGLTHFVGMSGVESENGRPAAELDRADPKAGVFGYKQIATPEMITDGQSQTILLLGAGDLVSPWAVGGGATIRGARPKSFAPHSGFGSTGGPRPGTFVLFADGSVRFVSAEVDEAVFNAMSTTHGQDTVDLPALQGSGSVIGK